MPLTKNVVILQGEIPSYRVPFFNSLGSQEGIVLTVVHSGKRSERISSHFNEIHVPKIGLAGIKFQLFSFRQLLTFDVIIIPLDVSWVSSVLLCFLCKPKSYLLWGHGLGRSPMANRIRAWLIRKSAGVILYGDETRRDFSNLTDKIFIAPNTIEVTHPSFNDANERHVFLYVGRPQARKKVHELFEAFADIEDKLDSSIVIEIVGEEDDELKVAVKRNKLEHRVRFLGEIREDAELRPIFHRALAYVSPGHVGLGVLHSFAFGVPVVTRRESDHAPEFHNLVHEKNAILYDGSISGLSSVLLRFANDQELSKKLGYQGYCLYSNNRSMKGMVSGFLKAINSMI